jgi:hypothetical protein
MLLAWIMALVAAFSSHGGTFHPADTVGGPSAAVAAPADTYGGPSPADTYGGPSAAHRPVAHPSDTIGGPS